MQIKLSATTLEIVVALILIGFSALIYYGTLELPAPRFEPLGSASVPQGLAVIMAVLCGVWLARSVLMLRQSQPAASETDEPADMPKRHPYLAAAVFVVTIVFVAVMDLGLLGFNIAGILYMTVIGYLLTHRNVRQLPWVVGYALVLVTLCDYVFTQFFYINLP